ncbi:hypothetical protein WJX84_004075 [Apatococcus fuscideae]|uniref:Uncharacterized protein n=1 Tax=Apatococcus fuscideae TaxID=2026836 RepID=A0AAW1T718_9CHLO
MSSCRSQIRSAGTSRPGDCQLFMPDLQRKLELKTAALSQVLLQMANGGTPDDGTNLSSSPSMEVVAILQESAERLNLFTSQVALRKERDDAHRIAQDLQAHHESAWQMTCQELHAKKNQMIHLEDELHKHHQEIQSLVSMKVTQQKEHALQLHREQQRSSELHRQHQDLHRVSSRHEANSKRLAEQLAATQSQLDQYQLVDASRSDALSVLNRKLQQQEQEQTKLIEKLRRELQLEQSRLLEARSQKQASQDQVQKAEESRQLADAKAAQFADAFDHAQQQIEQLKGKLAEQAKKADAAETQSQKAALANRLQLLQKMMQKAQDGQEALRADFKETLERQAAQHALAYKLAERQAALVAKIQHEHDRRSVRQEEEHTLIMAKELERVADSSAIQGAQELQLAHANELTQMQDVHRSAQQQTQADHSGTLQQQEAAHEVSLAQLNAAHEGKLRAYEQQYSVLKDKYLARESRQEDVAKIADLRRIVQEQAAANAIAENNLQQMRAELLLREHNFNKTFQGGGGLQALAVDKAMNAQKGVVDWMIKPKARSKQVAGRRTLG